MYLLDALFFLRVRPSFLPQGDATGAGRPRTCPRRRPAGGRRGSSPRHGRSDACSSSGRGRPCRARSARARGCPPRRPCPCRSPGSAASRPLGRRSVAIEPSLAISWTLVPAERAILAPAPGFSSIAWITVPTGMLRSGSALPGRISASGPDISVSPCLHALRREDVALLAVGVVQQRDARAPVRVVLDVRDLGGHAVLVPLEVDHAVAVLVPAAVVARRDAAVDVAPGLVAALRRRATSRASSA